MDIDIQLLQQSQNKSSTTENILLNLDTLALKIGEIIRQYPNMEIAINFENIAFIIGYKLPNNLLISSNQSSNGQPSLTLSQNTTSNNEDSSVASFYSGANTFMDNEDSLVYSYLFNKPTLFKTKQYQAGRVGYVGSPVLAVTISNNETIAQNQSIELSFVVPPNFLKNMTNEKVEELCCFWNFTTDTWSNYGCHKVDRPSNRDDVITCRCNHLTNFAVLLDVEQGVVYNPLALQYVSIIGCWISITGLVITIVCHLVFRKVMRKLPPKILINLCVSILALLLVFLFGVDQSTSSSRITCQIMAALLHYFTLTTFCWTLVEAYNLYKNFVKIFNMGGSNKKFMYFAMSFAWGFPLLIVGISSSVAPQNLGSKDFCVVIGNTLYIGLLAPIALILLINYFAFGFILKSITSRKVVANSNKTQQKDELQRQLRSAFTIATLLGMTWIFAILAIGDVKETFQWLFSISTSLQGFCIFVLYTVRNPEIQNEFYQCLGVERNNKKHSTASSAELAPMRNRNHSTSFFSRGTTRKTTL
ncbi:adhesion G-protein coupled receptor G2-like [Clytia hemisphaerica]